MTVISGINPVKEHINKNKTIQEIWVAREKKGGRIQELIDLARKKGVTLRFKESTYLDKKVAPGARHQGVIALLTEYNYWPLADITRIAFQEKGMALVVALDHITDGGNLGSVIRSSEFFGAHGIIISRDRSALITDTVHKRSAGGTAFLPVSRAVNLARALRELADKGLWIIGATGDGETEIYDFDWTRGLVLVLGSEDKGLGNAVRKQCHTLVRIPGTGNIDSLNVSVAAGVILSEITRQRKEGRSRKLL